MRKISRKELKQLKPNKQLEELQALCNEVKNMEPINKVCMALCQSEAVHAKDIHLFLLIC